MPRRAVRPSYKTLIAQREKRNARARAYAARPDVKEKRKAYAQKYRLLKANPLINISY